jgi:hypothetical protein
MKRILILIGILFPTILLSQVNDTYEIYSKIIRKEFRKYEKITIDNITSIHNKKLNDSSYVYFKENLPNLKKETFNNFILMNKKIDSIKNSFRTRHEILILSKKETDEIFENKSNWENDGGWVEFYKKYGTTQGLLELSRVGFDRVSRQALVYYGNQSHARAGVGLYVLFEKKGKRWIKRESFMAWIS